MLGSRAIVSGPADAVELHAFDQVLMAEQDHLTKHSRAKAFNLHGAVAPERPQRQPVSWSSTHELTAELRDPIPTGGPTMTASLIAGRHSLISQCTRQTVLA
jgi:hypothetical protein